MLSIGDKAPDFSLLSNTNETISLHNLRGKKIILYFYPKDNTPGCTQEACEFRDAFTHLEKENVTVIGISKDKPTTHQKFIQKYALPFPLLSDSDAKVCEAYGVINPKSMFGKTFLGIQRSTFLIDENGNIRAIWRKVKVNGHLQEVQNELSKI